MEVSRLTAVVAFVVTVIGQNRGIVEMAVAGEIGSNGVRGRTDRVLRGGWTADGQPVEIPHCWNVDDACDGKGVPDGWEGSSSVDCPSYERKTVTYRRALPSPTPGRRQFIRFEGASVKATVSVNGRTLGVHKGAFTAFTFELTETLKPSGNVMEVVVNEVIAKATSDLHGKILKKIGADQVIFPDRDSAHRLARSIIDHGAFDLLELSEGCSIAEIDVPESCVDKTLAETDLRKKTGVTVLCIRRPAANPKKPRELLIPTPTEKILAGDRLIVFGSMKQIDGLTFER